jgi:metal-responsive CopG/Arc/MetJ family transcriptional regulator
MNTDVVRMNITLPRKLVVALDNLTGHRKRSLFISEAVQQKIQQIEKDKLDTLLAEGYQASKQDSIELVNEFEGIDIEGWDDY